MATGSEEAGRRPTALRRCSTSEAAGPGFLLAAAAIALLWANSRWRGGYGSLWGTDVRLAAGSVGFRGDLRHLVDDGLMALFFLAVGLEIGRERVEGDLRHWPTAALPAIAAVGGMIVPALLYATLNAGKPGAPGWGIPMATDIAFAVGVLALLGSRVPPGLKLFLLTLAVVDDVGAVAVIAVFYSSSVRVVPLVAAGLLLVLTASADRSRFASVPLFAALGVAAWLAFLQSGVHAALAGVALGLVARPGPATVARRLERALGPVVTFAVLPVFALANAGVTLGSGALDHPGAGSVAAGVAFGLVAGKVAGVAGAAWLGVRTKRGALPNGVSWRQLLGAAALAGVGFTVSLLVADLAFADARLRDAAKLGILTASAVAALVGAAVLLASRPTSRAT
jgi:NhaA family Na+:H+ antiporter